MNSTYIPNIYYLRTLHMVCREKFAKYSRKICKIFAKYLRNICEESVKNSQKIHEKFKFAKYSQQIREKIRKNSRMLIFCEFFANILQIFREFFTTDHGKSPLVH